MHFSSGFLTVTKIKDSIAVQFEADSFITSFENVFLTSQFGEFYISDSKSNGSCELSEMEFNILKGFGFELDIVEE